ncbi:MAG: polyphosphate polymerase domain-containing protein [Bacteroidales bacterium]|nr:polyphosphate polymerase domain-containing protein [Bacteroidales bacterium]
MKDLTLTLSNFVPISLEAMEHVKLLDRFDTKYIIHEDQLKEYLEAIGSQYMLLVIGGKLVHPYETLYFDTPDFHLYYMHHSGMLNRYKLRCRKYVNSGISYFEVKSKTNTRRTIKNRMQVDDIPEMLTPTLNQYITDHTPGVYHDYIPVLRVFFDRITLVNKLANERLTFDINLRYKRNGIEKKLLNMVIVEVKQEKHTVSPLRELMKTKRQSQDYLSKYCMGLTCLNKGLKKNHFKQKINTLNKLGYDIH